MLTLHDGLSVCCFKQTQDNKLLHMVSVEVTEQMYVSTGDRKQHSKETLGNDMYAPNQKDMFAPDKEATNCILNKPFSIQNTI